MAKKNQEVAPPAISTIPLADQDSPLVIDLPDGQKLVVGNIAQGTVIEVATWRGTGRPDSRTSRLMLGVSSASATESQSASTQTSEPSNTTESGKQNVIKNFFTSLVAKTPKQKREKAVKEIDRIFQDDEVTTTDSHQGTVPAEKRSTRISKALEESDDIQSWLDDLMNGAGSTFESESAAPTKAGKVKRISSPQRRSNPKSTSSARKKSSSVRTSSPRARKTTKSRSRKSKKR